MSIALPDIIRIILFVSWVTFSVLIFRDFLKKMYSLADKYHVIMPYQCKKCLTVVRYTHKEYRKNIAWKPRNEIKRTISLSSGKFGASRTIISKLEHKFHCPTCNKKQYQCLLPSISDEGYAPAQKKLVVGLIIKIIAIGFLVVISFVLLVNFEK